MFDILIKNGQVLNGLRAVPQKMDVAVTEGKIAEIAPNIPERKAVKVIDAKDKFVAPGFIDIQNHSDSYWTLFDQPEQTSLVAQGITTIVVGNCGSSLAPLPSTESIKTIQKWHNLSGLNINWSSFAEFLEVLKLSRLGVNVGSLVGHANLRRGLIGDEIRPLSPEELKTVDKLLSEALSEGALGLSLGLVYAHEVDSTTTELVELGNNLKKNRKYLSVHLRSESSNILEAIDEAIMIGRRAEVPVKISHLKLRGRINWHLFDNVINKLETAYHQGLDISFDVYPYNSTWSVLYTYLPKWAYEGGRLQTLRRINSPLERNKIIDFLKNQEYEYDNIIVASAEGSVSLIGKSVSMIADNANISREEALLKILSADQSRVIVFDHNLSEEQVEMFLSSPLSLIATDGAGYVKDAGQNLVHPRCFGAMPRFLRLVREKKLMSWEEAIKKLTSEPARLLGLRDRGRIKEKFAADLVVFDPNLIADRADYNHPFKLPSGMEHVIVNGKLAFTQGRQIGSFGNVVKR